MKRVCGKVIWFNSDKGFGVIEAAGAAYYAHYSEVVAQARTEKRKISQAQVEANLIENQVVTFEVSSDRHCDMSRALKIEVTR